MKRFAHVIGALTAGVALLLGPTTTTANADTGTGQYGTLTAADASAFKDQCVNEHEQLTVTSQVDTSNTRVTITGPGGVAEYGSFDGGGTGTVQLCTYTDPPGTYTVHVALYDSDYSYLGALDTTFKLTLLKASLKAHVQKTGHDHYRVVVVATVNHDPLKGRTVRPQVNLKGLWIDVPGTDVKKRTDNRGRVTYTFHPKPNHYVFRFHIDDTAKMPEVTSKPFRVPAY